MALISRQEPSRFSYQLLLWGELIYGSKDELQALGLAPGMAFPGEPGGPRRRLKITDPRGFACKIECAKYVGEGQFMAAIRLPGREQPAPLIETYAPGVTLERIWWGDFYRGTADALIKAGLVRAEQFPGMPGMGKTTAKFMADGTVAPVGGGRHNLGPGSMTIDRDTTRLFTVSIHADVDESNRRHEAMIAADRAHAQYLATLPRPAPLVAPDREAAAQKRRAQLRLVWSKPTAPCRIK